MNCCNNNDFFVVLPGSLYMGKVRSNTSDVVLGQQQGVTKGNDDGIFATDLGIAQSYARQAVAVSSVDPTAAVGEHDRAASQYATAAKDTSSSEAFRTLKLLESYHERLSQLLKFQNAHPVAQASESPSEEKSSPQQPPSNPPSKSQEESPYRTQQPVHPLPPRDISSSIASNLASARGIPTNRQRRGSPASPASSTQHAEGRLTTPARRSRLSEYPSRAAPNPIQEKVETSLNTPVPAAGPSLSKAEDTPSAAPPTDEPFQRFYSTFAPLFSALSAPLAFAGLPLGLDNHSSPDAPAPPQASTTKTKPSKSSVTATLSDNPDYTRAFSRAALRALNSERGGGYPTHESFYVVPTSGHTTSYADILARTQREAAKGLAVHGEAAEEAEFVDARETPQPPSPEMARGKGGGKTMEELTLENAAMRDLLDVLSKRLAQFEMGSQSQSQALYQSFRMMKQSQNQSPAAGVGKGEPADPGEVERVGVLEARLQDQQRELERMGKENEKLKGVVGRYRERWEKLKEGARGRREGTGTTEG